MQTEKKEERRLAKQHLSEDKILSRWLLPAIEAAWKSKEFVRYSPKGYQQYVLAGKYFDFFKYYDAVDFLEKRYVRLDELIRTYNRFLIGNVKSNQKYLISPMADRASLILKYQNLSGFFDDSWGSSIKSRVQTLKKSFLVAGVSEAVVDGVDEPSEIDNILSDPNVIQILNLSNAVKPKLNEFYDCYRDLENSPDFRLSLKTGGVHLWGMKFPPVVTERERKFALVRAVLLHLDIRSDLTDPDLIGKCFAALQIANGKDVLMSIVDNISIPSLRQKISAFISELEDEEGLIEPSDLKHIYPKNLHNPKKSPRTKNGSAAMSKVVSPRVLMSDHAEYFLLLTDALLQAVKDLAMAFKQISLGQLRVKNGIYFLEPMYEVKRLVESGLHMNSDLLIRDVRWIKSRQGKKFKSWLSRYVDSVFSQNYLSFSLKIFSVDEGLLFETPDGDEVYALISWIAFERILRCLRLTVVETRSDATVKFERA